MKKIIFLILSFWCFNTVFTQVPNRINYQSIIRDSNGNPVMNQNVGLKFNIRQGYTQGSISYSELHFLQTNNFGLVNLQIGNGQVVSGSFNSIDWSTPPQFCEILVDISGGTNFIIMGTQELITVPYSFVSQKALDDKDEQTLTISNNSLSISNGNTITLPQNNDNSITNEIQSLSLNNNVLSISQGNSVNLPVSIDNDTSNELQNLSINGDTLFISNGNSVVIPNSIILESPNGNQYELSVNDSGYFSTTLLCNPGVAQANAGSNQTMLQNTTFQLAANSPSAGTTGQWSIISGNGGVFSNVNAFNSTFTGVAGQTYILRWTLSNNCASSYDDITISFSNFQLPSCNCQGQTLYSFPSANSTDINWGPSVQIGPIAQTPNDGLQNTNAIVAAIGANYSYAPQLCYNLNAYGYSDWYLPSKDELNCLYNNGYTVGLTYYVWSSSEYGTSLAWAQNFTNGIQDIGPKVPGSAFGAVCVRKD